ncbi:tudor and KH domain-containing protein-like [Dermatophagoides pteronyssinus]|uniref:tudor and KH domain-containing protein-like n=1 Tax=Dermatophagoides pteronyssinus TaxID=6956 RepID=UPI003F67438D
MLSSTKRSSSSSLSSSIKSILFKYVIQSIRSRMCPISKNFYWFGGIGASLIFAYGSIYLFYSNRFDDDDDNDEDDHGKDGKNDDDDDRFCPSNFIKNADNFSTTKHSQFNDNDGGSDTMSDDSSIEIIILYKQISNRIFEQNDCFKQIQLKTETIIEENHNNSTTINGQYRNILIKGFHKNVMQASRLIDQLLVNHNDEQQNSPLIECKRFEILSTKLPLIIGINGITMKSLIERSGANIHIDHQQSSGDNNGGSQFTTVDIYGNNEQIKMAFNLINELLDQERRFFNDNNRLKQQQLTTKFDDNDLDSFEMFDSTNDLIIVGDNHPQYIRQQSIVAESSSSIVCNRTSLTREQISYMTESFDVIDDDHDHHPDRSISPSILPPIQVYVSHIEHPGRFYVQINENRRSVRLDELMDEMKKFYSNIENQYACRCDSSTTLKINDLVAIKVDDNGDDDDSKFYRGYITGCLDDNNLFSVFYGDFGITAQHSPQSLFYLNGNFLTRLPFQAICCSLNELSIDEQWSIEEIKQFREWTREGLWESIISIRCYRYHYDDNGQRTYMVEMFSKQPNQLMTINVGRKLKHLHNQRLINQREKH